MRNDNAIARLEVLIIEKIRMIKDRKERVIRSFSEKQYDKYVKRYQCLESATTIENIRGITLDKNTQMLWLEHNIAVSELKHLEYTMKVLCPAWNKILRS